MTTGQRTTRAGQCHCGAVRFEVVVPDPPRVQRCNCSICTKCAYLHLIVPARDFRLLEGEASLQTYAFHTGVARHQFCRHCGVKAFYVPRSNPDGWSVNARCVTGDLAETADLEDFDGRDWERHGPTLAGLTRSPT